MIAIITDSYLRANVIAIITDSATTHLQEMGAGLDLDLQEGDKATQE